jgi:hypothetical protein
VALLPRCMRACTEMPSARYTMLAYTTVLGGWGQSEWSCWGAAALCTAVEVMYEVHHHMMFSAMQLEHWEHLNISSSL